MLDGCHCGREKHPTREYKLTDPQRSGQSSDDRDGVLWVCAELQQHGREGVPFALQLHQQKTKRMSHDIFFFDFIRVEAYLKLVCMSNFVSQPKA